MKPCYWFVEWSNEYEAHLHAVRRVIAKFKTKYQSLEVIETYQFGKTLVLDGKTQSTLGDEWIYHESLVHPPLIAHGEPRKVLVIGGGEGATLREALRYKTVRGATMVDIDEEVIEIAKKELGEWHQGAFFDPRVKLVIADGRKFLESVEEEYDAIILDLTDPLEGGPSAMLYTKQFYELVKKALKPGGVMVTQATSPWWTPYAYATIYNTLKAVFKKVRAYSAYVPSFDSPWGFVAASDEVDPGELTADEVDRRIEELIGAGVLKFYDGETHEHLMSLPKNIRILLESAKNIATDENPVFVP